MHTAMSNLRICICGLADYVKDCLTGLQTTMVVQTSLMGPLIIMGDGWLALYSDCLHFCWLSFFWRQCRVIKRYSMLRTENIAFVLQFLNLTDRRFIITRNGLWPKLCQILVWKAQFNCYANCLFDIQIKDWYWLDMEIFESIKMMWLLRAVEMTVPLSWGDNSLCQILVTISRVPTLLPSLL